MYNTVTDETQAIQGQVDKDTQRVAFRIGDNQDVHLRDGLVQPHAERVPLLVHYGTERTENYLLVRLDAPPEEDAAATGGAAAPAAADPFAQ